MLICRVKTMKGKLTGSSFFCVTCFRPFDVVLKSVLNIAFFGPNHISDNSGTRSFEIKGTQRANFAIGVERRFYVISVPFCAI